MRSWQAGGLIYRKGLEVAAGEAQFWRPAPLGSTEPYRHHDGQKNKPDPGNQYEIARYNIHRGQPQPGDGQHSRYRWFRHDFALEPK